MFLNLCLLNMVDFKCMQKKVVVKVSMNGQKSRTKALKIAVGLSGNKEITQ